MNKIPSEQNSYGTKFLIKEIPNHNKFLKVNNRHLGFYKIYFSYFAMMSLASVCKYMTG